MTVKQLINKLKKLDESAEVLIENDEFYVEGIYKATRIEDYSDENSKAIIISSNYKKKVN